MWIEINQLSCMQCCFKKFGVHGIHRTGFLDTYQINELLLTATGLSTSNPKLNLFGQLKLTYSMPFFSILLTHEGSHREVYRDFQPSLTSSAGGVKSFSDHKFCAPPTYTAQLLTLHQHRANNQYRMAKSNLADFKG